MAITKICADKRLADLSITTAKLADDSVTAAKLADNAVNTAELVNGAVTNAKLGIDSVKAVNLDETESYVVSNITVDSDTGDNNKVVISGNGSLTTNGGELNIQNVAGDTSFLKVATSGVVSTSGNAYPFSEYGVAETPVITSGFSFLLTSSIVLVLKLL